MDSGDLIIGGLVLGGAYLAWRAYTNANAEIAAPGTASGAAASSMNAGAAASTNFGNAVLQRRLLAPILSLRPVRVLAATASPIAAARAQFAAAAPVNAQVAAAAAMPAPVAPPQSRNLLIPVLALRAFGPTQPSGSDNSPGVTRPAVLLRGLR